MDKDDIIYLLRNYKRNKGNIDALKSKIEVLETIATRTTPQYDNDGSQHSKFSTNSKVENACIKIQTYNEQIEGIQKLVDATEKELLKLKYHQRYIITERYVEHKKIKQIAREQKTTENNISKLLSKSMTILTKE